MHSRLLRVQSPLGLSHPSHDKQHVTRLLASLVRGRPAVLEHSALPIEANPPLFINRRQTNIMIIK